MLPPAPPSCELCAGQALARCTHARAVVQLDAATGAVVARNSIIFKVSRTELATLALRPPPAEFVKKLLADGYITKEQAAEKLAARHAKEKNAFRAKRRNVAAARETAEAEARAACAPSHLVTCRARRGPNPHSAPRST